MVRSGAQYPRDALSKGCNIQELLVRDIPVGDEITLHPKQFKPLLFKGGGGGAKPVSIEVTVNSKEEKLLRLLSQVRPIIQPLDCAQVDIELIYLCATRLVQAERTRSCKDEAGLLFTIFTLRTELKPCEKFSLYNRPLSECTRRTCTPQRWLDRVFDHGVHTERQLLLCGVHSIMMEKLAQPDEGGSCTTILFQYIIHYVQSCGVRFS
jgi:hypothetical protein